MNRMTQLMGGSALAALVLAAPAGADVTPQQVWDDLETYVTGLGYTVSGTEDMSGDVLTISDVVFAMDLPEGEGRSSIAAGTVVLTDQGDGTVAVTLPGTMPVTMTMTPETGEALDVALDFTQSGLDMVVSGTPGDIVWDYTAQSMGLVLTRLVVDGETVGRDAARMDVSLSGVEGQSSVALGEMRDIAQQLGAEALRYDLAFVDPDSGGTGQLTGQMDAPRFEANGLLPLTIDAADPADMFAAGLDGSGQMSHSGGSMTFAATEQGRTTTGATSTGSGEISVGFSDDAVSYDVRSTDLDLSLESPDLPFPVAAQMAESAFNVTVPVSRSETPQDMALGLTLDGFTMSDMLWNIFDPSGALPRDPATVALDLTGTVTPFVDWFDPEAAASLEQTGGVPGELNSLSLRDLTVDAVGARLTGQGDFTFDNDNLEAYDGMPAPEGTVTLNLTGGNALIDRLIAMGLLAEQDAMGARMMISMFSVPGQGEDSLTSTIEMRGNGQILANGQRIK